MNTLQATRHPASFRDPSGFVFVSGDGELLRQVNRSYQKELDRLESCGLYRTLVDRGLLVGHEVVDKAQSLTDDAYAVLKPERLPFISYPYEWSFGALKDGAILTLEMQKLALARGMSLKDASAYNIQFIGCQPIFIDTLSFEIYQENKPWVAYGQFCRHFLAPLMLMAHTSVDLGRLSELFVDGIPLELASSMLPWRTKLSFAAQVHVHLHAKMLRKHASTVDKKSAAVGKLSKEKQILLLDNLLATIQKLTWQKSDTEWGNYYDSNSYTEESASNKRQIVSDFLVAIKATIGWDLGANTGEYSKLLVDHGAYCCAWDIDPACVEMAYQRGKQQDERRLLPLRVDLATPSPSLGWAHQERESLAERGPVDVVMALALIHHLAIANNVPLGDVAKYFRTLADSLIIEWVPKDDVQVQRLLLSREDIFKHYDEPVFESAFATYFTIDEKRPVGNGGRILYRMTGKS